MMKNKEGSTANFIRNQKSYGSTETSSKRRIAIDISKNLQKAKEFGGLSEDEK